ncbi:MAG TPA: hypothetical protein VFF73_13620, partial [Planctomycetota bacterium]|nr:hypothetical protein [Planctomycetota bacterium]
FPVERAYGVSVFVSMLLAAFAAHALARARGISPFCAAVAGLTFAGGSFFSARVLAGHMPLLEAAWGLPLLLALIEWRRPVLLAVATGALALSGHPQLPAYSIVIAALYAAITRAGRAPLVALGLGALLSAFQWLPALDYIARSSRTLGLGAGRNDVSLDPGRALALLLPEKDGLPVAGGTFTAGIAARFWDTTAYVGILGWIAVPALVRRHRVLAVLAGAALLLAFLPGAIGSVLVLRSPSRWLYVTVLGLSIGCGACLDALFVAAARSTRVRAPELFALIATVAVIALLRGEDGPWRRGLVVAGATIGIVALALHAEGRSRLLVLACLVIVHGFDVLSFSARLVETEECDEVYAESQPLADFLGPRIGASRVAILSRTYHAQNLARRFDAVGCFDSLFEARTVRAFYAFAGEPLREEESLPDARLSPAGLARFAARWVVSDEPFAGPGAVGVVERAEDAGIHLYELTPACERASFVASVTFASDPEAAVARAIESPLDTAVLEGAPHAVADSAPGSVTIAERASSSLKLHASSPHGGVVRVAEAWDPGWEARIDGAPATVVPADGALMALEVPPGEHEVTLFYRTRRVGVGMLVTLATVGMGAAWVWSSRRRAEALAK